MIRALGAFFILIFGLRNLSLIALNHKGVNWKWVLLKKVQVRFSSQLGSLMLPQFLLFAFIFHFLLIYVHVFMLLLAETWDWPWGCTYSGLAAWFTLISPGRTSLSWPLGLHRQESRGNSSWSGYCHPVPSLCSRVKNCVLVPGKIPPPLPPNPHILTPAIVCQETISTRVIMPFILVQQSPQVSQYCRFAVLCQRQPWLSSWLCFCL